MSNAIRYLLWMILSIGMFFLAIMFFWVFLIILAVFIIGRLIYMKLFNKNAVTFYSYTMYNGKTVKNLSHNPDLDNPDLEQEFTTVIDADDMEKEYKVPKIK